MLRRFWWIWTLVLAGCGGPQDTPAISGPVGAPPATAATTTAVPTRPNAYHTVVQQLYVAYFGRPADPKGLAFFSNRLAQIGAPTDIQEFNAAYQRSAPIREVIDAFGNSKESSELYTGDTRSFVSAIYTNVLNRAPDAGGLDFWSKAIDSGALTKGNTSLYIMASALGSTNPQAAAEAALVRNKIAAATAFTGVLTTDERVDAYSGQAASAIARTYLSQMKASTDRVTMHVNATSALAKLLNMATGRVVFSGTVALGRAVKEAEVEVYDLDGMIGKTATDLQGRWLLPAKVGEILSAPFFTRTRFTVDGVKHELSSISTDSPDKGNIEINNNPLENLKAKAYAWAQGLTEPDPSRLANNPGLMTRIGDSLKKIVASMLPSASVAPESTPFVPNPVVSEQDALLERIVIDTVLRDEARISDVNGKAIASVKLTALANGTVGNSDTELITAKEAADAAAARGAPRLQGPHINQAATASIPAPANFRAIQTGNLSFRLQWDAVDKARQYHIYEQEGSPPGITAGRYPSTHQPTYSVLTVQSGTVDFEYEVPRPGTYYWVIAVVADDGSTTSYQLGATSDAESLTFDENKQMTCKTETRASDPKIKEFRCYYLTGTAPFTTIVNHGTYIMQHDGLVVATGRYVDGKRDGKWEYLRTVPNTLKRYELYDKGVLAFTWVEYDSTSGELNTMIEEQVWKLDENGRAYIAASRNYCGKGSSVREDRRGALYLSMTYANSNPLGSGIRTEPLKCQNGAVSGEICCDRD